VLKDTLTVIGIPLILTLVVWCLPVVSDTHQANKTIEDEASLKEKKREIRQEGSIRLPLEATLLSFGILVQILLPLSGELIIIGVLVYTAVLGYMIFTCRTCENWWAKELKRAKARKLARRTNIFAFASLGILLTIWIFENVLIKKK